MPPSFRQFAVYILQPSRGLWKFLVDKKGGVWQGRWEVIWKSYTRTFVFSLPLPCGMFPHFPCSNPTSQHSFPNYNTQWSLLCLLSFVLAASDLFLAVLPRMILSSLLDGKLLKGPIMGLLYHPFHQNS